MKTRAATIGAAALLALPLLAGCATPPAENGFSEVAEVISGRLGQRLHWRRGTAEDEQVDQAVQALLGQELDLEKAVQIALLENRHLQAVYAELGLAQANLVQAGLLRNPIFSASTGIQLTSGSPDLTFSIAQDFLSLFYLPLRKRVAESEFEAAKLRVGAAVVDLAAEVGAAYYRSQAARQLLEMRQRVAAASAATYDAAKRLREAGNIRSLDLDNEQGLHVQARLSEAAAEVLVTEARERLRRLMGVSGTGTELRIAGRLPPLAEQAFDLDRLEERALEANMGLAIVRQDIESLGRRLGLAETTALVPELELGAEAERDDGVWDAGPSLSVAIPFFDRGQARIAAVKAELEGRRQEYLAHAVDIRAAVTTARHRLTSARYLATEYQTVVLPLQTRIVDQTQRQYNAMQIGIFQLLASVQQQIAAGELYIVARRDYWLARNDLIQILNGRLPPASAGSADSP